MHGSLRFRSLIKTERPLGDHLEVARLALPALAASTLVLGAISGLLATKLPLQVTLLALASLAAVLGALSRPEFVILLMLIISSSIIDPNNIPRFSVGLHFTLAEMCLLFLLGLVVVRALSDKEDGFVRTPLDWPVFLFFVASTLSYSNAIYNLGTHRGLLVRVWRTLFNYLVFFAVTNHVRTRRQLMTLVHSMFVMTTIMAALVVIQGVVGPSVRVMPSARVLTAGALGQEFEGVARVILPGTILLSVTFLLALILFATPECLPTRKWLLFIPVLLLLVAIAMTFGRSLWIGIVLSLAILLFISPAGQRKYLLTTLCIIVVVLFSSTWLLKGYVPRTENVIEALSFRAGSLFSGDRIVHEQRERICENKSAIGVIKEHPLLGVGPGGPIHTKMCLYQGGKYTRYVHNSYLFILADLGLLGFLPFLWFSVAYLVRGFFFGRKLQDPVLRGLVLGFTLSYIVVIMDGMGGPTFMSSSAVPVIGVIMGINEVAIRLGQQGAQRGEG